MITYLLMAAVSAAAFFYARWQQARASRAEAEVSSVRAELQAEAATHSDRILRYERTVAGLKLGINELENLINAETDPAFVRTAFGRLFPPNS